LYPFNAPLTPTNSPLKKRGDYILIFTDAEIIKLKGILRELQNDLDGVTDIYFNNALKTILQ